MTKQDYILLANAIAQASKECKTSQHRLGVQKVTEHISHALKIDNERFQEGKFAQYILMLTKE